MSMPEFATPEALIREKTILVVDDEPDVVWATTRMLEKAGYTVLSGSTAAEASSLTKMHRPALVLLDVVLPDGDGLEVARQIKLDPDLAGVFVVLLSGIQISPQEQAAGLKSAQADGYVIKPFSNVDFLARIEAFLRIRSVQEALRESEERYRILFTRAVDGIFILSVNGKLVEVNESLARMHGYSTQEMLHMTLKDLDTPETSQLAPERMSRVLAGESLTFEVEHYHKDGHVFPLEVSVSLISSGGESCIQCFHRDITERKLAEEALRVSVENFRRSLDESPLGVRVVSTEGETLYVNRATLDIFGCNSIEEWQTTPTVKRYTEQSHAEFKVRREKRRLGEDDSPEYGIDIVRKNGEVRNLYVWRTRVLWNGEEHYQLRYSDITDSKRSEKQLQDTLDSLRRAVGATMQVMVSAVERRDPYTAGHQIRSADLSRAIATEMGLPQKMIEGIRMAGSIHDIGKLSVPAEILSKPTKLSEIEFSLIKEHARQGYEILKNVESPWPLAEIVYQHHERMDGSGYPRHLKGDGILMEARILAVADVVESMASHRPYRAGLGINAALEETVKNRGTLYDEAVVDACLRQFREKGYRLFEA